MKEEEVFLNGFCRCQNQGRIVLCVYSENDIGNRQIEEVDCGFFACPHREACEIAKEAEAGLQM